MTNPILNLTGVPCPINFVRTKLKLDAMQSGEILEVLLDDGEPITSVSLSITEEGHTILEKTQTENQVWLLKIVRNS